MQIFYSDLKVPNTDPPLINYSSSLNRKGSKEGNPFEEEEWDEYSNTDAPLVDRGEPGIPVKALYDYDGAEDDELTFKQGLLQKQIDNEA